MKGNIRVSDFGLAESIYTTTYLRVENHKGVKLPIKWTAPESISYGIYSEKTDMVVIDTLDECQYYLLFIATMPCCAP